VKKLTPETRFEINRIQALTFGNIYYSYEEAIYSFHINVYNESNPNERLLPVVSPQEGDIWQRMDGNTYHMYRGKWEKIEIPDWYKEENYQTYHGE
jgi:hypothetical protein